MLLSPHCHAFIFRLTRMVNSASDQGKATRAVASRHLAASVAAVTHRWPMLHFMFSSQVVRCLRIQLQSWAGSWMVRALLARKPWQRQHQPPRLQFTPSSSGVCWRSICTLNKTLTYCCPHNTLCMHLALSQMKDAKRACYGLKSELSKLKQQQQPQAQPQQPLSQETMLQQQRQKSPQQAVKVSTPCPSPSAAVAAAAAAATAAAAAEHEAVLSHLRSRLSAADALVQASCSTSCGFTSRL